MSLSSSGPLLPTTSIRPPTLPEAVLRELRTYLITGKLNPGDPVRVDRLAGELGVSAVPVREALRVLLAEGRVEHIPHRGYRVTRLSFTDVAEIFLICGLLEREALRRGVPAIDDDGIKRMEDLLAQLDSLPRDAALWERVALHQNFHFVPMGYAGLPRLLAELRKFWDHTDHYRSLYFFRSDDAGRRAHTQEHRALTEACVARDAERAIGLMDDHRAEALTRLARIMALEPGAEYSDAPPPKAA